MGSLPAAGSSGPSSVQNSTSSTPCLPPTDDDIEAVIQMATSARASPDGRGVRDTRTQLFVGNLPYRVRWQDLKDLFRKAGTVLRADVSLGPDNRSRGYGTVLLASAEDAGRAVDIFNGYSWQTRILEVRPDRLPPDFDNPSPAGGFPVSVPNLSGSLGASPFPSAGQNNPLLSTATESDYSSSFVYDGLGPSGAGGKNLFVGNLPFHCQWQDLKDLFRQAGTIIRADVALGQDGRSRGFGTVVFATDFDAERAVKMFNGFEYNGRQLKVHYDKFSQTSHSTTDPTSPIQQVTYPHNTPFGSHHLNHLNHIPVPVGYHYDLSTISGPSSPYGGPPNSSLTQASQAHSTSVDQLSATLASTNLSENATSSDEKQNTLQSRQQHHHGNSNHHHAHPGPISLPPPPSVHAFPIPQPLSLSPHTISPLHHPMSPIQQQQQHLMTPHGLPPITPSMPPFSFLPQPSPHGHAATSNNMQNLNTSPMHAAHVLSTFSPGVAMSPGAFWGRPGGGVNPFINPAVGAPVHGSPSGFFNMNVHPVSPGANMEEPAGYFPPVQESGYFPPMASSNLENEILRDKSGDDDTPGSVSSGATEMRTHNTEPRRSSSTAAFWRTPEEQQTKTVSDTEETSSSSSPSSILPDYFAEDALNGAQGILRTNSVNVAGKSADRAPMNQGVLDPVHTRSRDHTDIDRRTSVGLGLSIASTDN